jgi:hypothetical protein
MCRCNAMTIQQIHASAHFFVMSRCTLLRRAGEPSEHVFFQRTENRLFRREPNTTVCQQLQTSSHQLVRKTFFLAEVEKSAARFMCQLLDDAVPLAAQTPALEVFITARISEYQTY